MPPVTKQLTLFIRATEEITTTEISEKDRRNTEEMNVAITTLAKPKIKGEGVITQEETNPTSKTEGLITLITINTNHN